MVLITGSSSLTGKKLVNRLLKDGEKVRCLDFEKPRDFPEKAEFITGDVLDDDLLKKACSGVDTVFHFMDLKRSDKKGRRYMKKINITGTEKIIRASQKAGVKKFMFLSSYMIYGKTKAIPIRQDDRKKAATRYGKQKLKAEKICWNNVPKQDMKITIFRPAVVVGPEVQDPMILITLFMALGMDDANQVYVYGNGDTRFQLLYPDDFISALVSARERDISAGKVYNLGSDNVPTQIEQMIKLKEIAKLDFTIKHLSPKYSKFLSIFFRPFRLNFLSPEHLNLLKNNIMLDCQRAKKDLDWQPTKDNMEILKETIEWYKTDKL